MSYAILSPFDLSQPNVRGRSDCPLASRGRQTRTPRGPWETTPTGRRGVAEDRVVEDLRERMASSAFHGWMGMTLVEARQGEVDLALEAQPHHLNLQGLLHGGVLATLADTAAGLAVRTKLEPGRRHVTIQLGVQYLSAGGSGRIVARGRTIRVGRQIAHAEAEIHDANGRLLATAQATVAIMAARD